VDVELRRDLWELITDLNDDGTTILLTTHYIEGGRAALRSGRHHERGQQGGGRDPQDLMERGTDTVEVGLSEAPTTAPTLDVEGVHSVTVEGDTLLVTAAGGKHARAGGDARPGITGVHRHVAGRPPGLPGGGVRRPDARRARAERRDGGGTVRSTGFRTLLHREILRYVRRPRNTFLPPVITNLLYFTVFGVVLGARIDLGDVGLQQTGLSPSEAYILFILPGLVVLGMISNAFENASFSIFHGRWNEYIHEVLTLAAVPHRDGTGLRHGVALRGVVVGLIIWGIGWLFAPVPLVNPFYLLRVHDRHPGAVRRLRSHRRALGGGFRLP